MAKKVAAKTPAPEQGADDLEILHPNRSATIRGLGITVREFGFIEGLRLRPLLQPFLDDLQAIMAGNRLPSLDQVMCLVGEHTDAITHAVAVSADVDMDWLATLNQDEGELLLMLWWAANGPFYVRSALQRIQAERQLAQQRAGATSTPSSSPPDTETPTPSDA